MFDPSPCIIDPDARHLCSRVHKKGAHLALTRLPALRHNKTVRETPALRKSSHPDIDV
jgi:hypothetical protein